MARRSGRFAQVLPLLMSDTATSQTAARPVLSPECRRQDPKRASEKLETFGCWICVPYFPSRDTLHSLITGQTERDAKQGLYSPSARPTSSSSGQLDKRTLATGKEQLNRTTLSIARPTTQFLAAHSAIGRAYKVAGGGHCRVVLSCPAASEAYVESIGTSRLLRPDVTTY